MPLLVVFIPMLRQKKALITYLMDLLKGKYISLTRINRLFEITKNFCFKIEWKKISDFQKFCSGKIFARVWILQN